MKDIFIDAQIANKFANPPNEHYSKFITWLSTNNKQNPELNAILVVSQKILSEYIGGNRGSYKSATTIAVIWNAIFSEKRFLEVSSNQIKEFRREFFKPKIVKCLRCNRKDWDHIPVVLLSNRQMILSDDDNFLHDVLNFPKSKVTAGRSPEDLQYE